MVPLDSFWVPSLWSLRDLSISLTRQNKSEGSSVFCFILVFITKLTFAFLICIPYIQSPYEVTVSRETTEHHLAQIIHCACTKDTLIEVGSTCAKDEHD